jgi:hypothetical protein
MNSAKGARLMSLATLLLSSAIAVGSVCLVPESVAAGSTSGLTGVYTCDSTDGKMYIKELPDHRIRFRVTAYWQMYDDNNKPSIKNSGECAAVVPVVNGKAVYKHKGDEANTYTITMNFKGKKCELALDGNGFGGMNVNPTGEWTRVSAKEPTKRQLP